MQISDIEIGLRIKEIREQNKLSKLDFSSSIGADNSTLGKIEKGYPASKEILLGISSKYGVSLDWLVYGQSVVVGDGFVNERMVILESLVRTTLRRVCHLEAFVEKVPFEDVYQKAKEEAGEALSDLDLDLVPGGKK